MLTLEFGHGKISVMAFGSPADNVTYGVAFAKHEEAHAINESDPSVMGKAIEDVSPVLCMTFTRSDSVQVVIDMLTKVRDSLVAWEQKQKENQQ